MVHGTAHVECASFTPCCTSRSAQRHGMPWESGVRTELRLTWYCSGASDRYAGAGGGIRDRLSSGERPRRLPSLSRSSYRLPLWHEGLPIQPTLTAMFGTLQFGCVQRPRKIRQTVAGCRRLTSCGPCRGRATCPGRHRASRPARARAGSCCGAGPPAHSRAAARRPPPCQTARRWTPRGPCPRLSAPGGQERCGGI